MTESKARIIADIINHVISSADTIPHGETTVRLKYQDHEVIAFEVQSTRKYKVLGGDFLKANS